MGKWLLKIKDNVDLKGLEKFGYYPVLNGNDNSIMYYEKHIMKFRCKKLLVSYDFVEIHLDRSIHFYNLRERSERYGKDWANDLIQAGLVERWENDEK